MSVLLWCLVVTAVGAVAALIGYDIGVDRGGAKERAELGRVVGLFGSYHFDIGETRHALITEWEWQMREWGYSIEPMPKATAAPQKFTELSARLDRGVIISL